MSFEKLCHNENFQFGCFTAELLELKFMAVVTGPITFLLSIYTRVLAEQLPSPDAVPSVEPMNMHTVICSELPTTCLLAFFSNMQLMHVLSRHVFFYLSN